MQSDLAQTQEQFYGSCLPDIANGDYSEAFYDCNQVLQIALSGTCAMCSLANRVLTESNRLVCSCR